jgi:DNA repair protein RadD
MQVDYEDAPDFSKSIELGPKTLWDFQQTALYGSLRESFKKGHRKILITSPTGTGKGTMISELTRMMRAKGTGVLVTTPRNLITSSLAEDMARQNGVTPHIMRPGGYVPDDSGLIVGNMASLQSRLRRGRYSPDAIQALIIDECHEISVKGEAWKAIQKHLPNAMIFGFTATPVRGDGQGMGNIFDDIVVATSYKDAIANGYIVGPEYWIPVTPDLTNVSMKKAAGGNDFDEKESLEAMEQAKTRGRMVEHWVKHAKDENWPTGYRLSCAFAINVKHSLMIQQAFRDAGFRFEHMDANTPSADRDKIVQDALAGRIHGITNVGIMPMGVDIRPISCIVGMRPTKSLSFFIQTLGRGTRVYEYPNGVKKDKVIYLDFAGNVDGRYEKAGYFEGFGPAEDYEFTQLTYEKPPRRKNKRVILPKTAKPIFCENCTHEFVGTMICPVCGYMHKKHAGGMIEETDHELDEYGRSGKKKKSINKAWPATPDELITAYQMAIWICEEKGYKVGAAAHYYKAESGGEWPPRGLLPLPPIDEARAWFERKRRQAYLKQRREKNWKEQPVPEGQFTVAFQQAVQEELFV